jgi:hypothetical protein
MPRCKYVGEPPIKPRTMTSSNPFISTLRGDATQHEITQIKSHLVQVIDTVNELTKDVQEMTVIILLLQCIDISSHTLMKQSCC